ncbi:hypothetical protein LJC72_02455 [Bacteroides sp. OttesenSCG-928-D19]|nr:hypothetical protein [Bacteroides sp. OttesenSCG-928-D19]
MIILEFIVEAIVYIFVKVIFEVIICGFFGFIGSLFGLNDKQQETKAQKRRKRKAAMKKQQNKSK